MQNFEYYRPVRIVFGKNTIPEVGSLIPKSEKIMLTYGGGSIKKNGVYDQAMNALTGHDVITFGGIEPNPEYETLMKAVYKARDEGVTFLLAIGGGSVLDGTKFIAAVIPYDDKNNDPWEIPKKSVDIEEAVPLGAVLTLPATGSEMNGAAVISRRKTEEKRAFISEHVFPRFSILDPETTYTLPERQTVNGIIDAFVHVMEQYMTYPADAPLQDRQAEAILHTLVEYGPELMKMPKDYDLRATIMWCATNALNNLIGVGVPQDWSTHMIGHEVTAYYGIDHARTLAAVLPGVWRHERERKKEKLLQYGERIWDITDGSDDARLDKTIEATEEFFKSFGVPVRLSEYDGITRENLERIPARFEEQGRILGEHGDIGHKEIREILKLCFDE